MSQPVDQSLPIQEVESVATTPVASDQAPVSEPVPVQQVAPVSIAPTSSQELTNPITSSEASVTPPPASPVIPEAAPELVTQIPTQQLPEIQKKQSSQLPPIPKLSTLNIDNKQCRNMENNCQVCSDLTDEQFKQYQENLGPSKDSISTILNNISNKPGGIAYKGVPLNAESTSGKFNIGPSEGETPIFCYQDSKNKTHYKRLYPKRIPVEEKSWTQKTKKPYIPADFTLGPNTLSVLDLSESCCGLKNSYKDLVNTCDVDSSSEVEPENYQNRKLCELGDVQTSLFGTQIQYGDGQVNNTQNDPNQGRPLNPLGRTGIAGKGILPKWGPNYESYLLLVQKSAGAKQAGGASDQSVSETDSPVSTPADLWEVKLEYKVNTKSLAIPSQAIGKIDAETPLLVAQQNYLTNLIKITNNELDKVVDNKLVEKYLREHSLQAQVTAMENNSYIPLLNGANTFFKTKASKSAYIVIEDIIRHAFSIEGGCVDLLYEGCIVDIRNTDNAWVEGAVYLFNLDATPTNVEEEYWKLIKPLSETNVSEANSNSYSWFNLNKASNGTDLDWESVPVTCCDGNGLVFVALAHSYLVQTDLEEAQHQEKIAKAKAENEALTNDIESQVSEITKLNKAVVDQNLKLQDDKTRLTGKINHLKETGLSAINKETGISYNEYRELLKCNSNNGLQDESICKDPSNNQELINQSWINPEYSSTHGKELSDVSSESEISKPLEVGTSSISSDDTSVSESEVKTPKSDMEQAGGGIVNNSDTVSYLFSD